MINSPSRWMCLVSQLCNADARVPILELIRVNQYGFVAHVFGTLDECLGILGLNVGLDLFGIAGANAVPKFGLPVVIIVDAAQIVVLSVAGEHGPKSADVKIRSVYAVERLLAQAITN